MRDGKGATVWFAFAVFSALASSFGDVFAKRVSRHYHFAVIAWAQRLVAAVVMAVFAAAISDGIPRADATFAKALAGTVALNTAATLMYARAISLSDVSRVAPVLALSPTFMLLTAPLISGENVTWIGAAGVLTSVLGAYALGVDGKAGGWITPFRNLWSDPGTRLMLGVALIWSVTSPLDLIAVRHTDAAWYPAIFNGCLAVMLAPFALRQTGFLEILRPEGLRRLAPVGACMGASQFFQASALTLIASSTYVIGVKRLQAVFSVILGWRVYREKGIRYKLIGASILVVGAGVILFGGRP